MPLEPPSFFRPTAPASGAAASRFGMGRRVRIREDSATIAAGANGVVERRLGALSTDGAAPALYRVRVALSDLGAAEAASEATIDLEVAEPDLAPFFDYSADPAAEAARIERAQAQRPRGGVARRAAPEAAALNLPFEPLRAATLRAWADPAVAAALVEDPASALTSDERAALGDRPLVFLANSDRECHRLVAVSSRDALGDAGASDGPALRLHQVLGARAALVVLPARPAAWPQMSETGRAGAVTRQALTGAGTPA